MPNGVPDNSNLLTYEGQGIILNFIRTTTTSGTLTWTIPNPINVYDGILITASIKETNPSNYPTDTVKYTASANLSVTSDTIGSAKVVVALYNDKITQTTTLTNLDPETVYYFSAHLVSNARTYYNVGVRSYPESPASEIYAGDMASSYGPPTNPAVGDVYYEENDGLVYVWNGAVWITARAHTVITGQFDPVAPFIGFPKDYPSIGDFFYNDREKMLKSWSGVNWKSAESKSGLPMYEKQNIGTNSSYFARTQLIDILKAQMGWPIVCVELQELHFNIAIDNALQELRRRIDNAYNKQFFFMTILPYQQTYYLNDKSVGTSEIVDVLKIHRFSGVGLPGFSSGNIYAQQFLNQFYSSGIGYDLVSIHLINSMAETYNQLFAGDVAFNWRESSRELKLYRQLNYQEKVLVETTCERLEQELLTDRWTQQWLQNWAISECMSMLAMARGKFSSLPGPGGGLQLNVDMLITESQRLQDRCLQEVKDYEIGQNGPNNFFSPIVIG